MITESHQQVSAPPDSGIAMKVQEIFRDGLELEVEMDTNVIEGGLLDSLAFVQLLLALEEEFGVKVDLAELELESFSTVSSIARLVSSNGNGPT